MKIHHRGRWAPCGALIIAALVIATGCSKAADTPGLAQPSSTAAATSNPTPSSSSAASSSTATSASVKLPEIMPDFVGGTQEEAEAVLKPLNVRIKTQNQISAEPAGEVVAQEPVAGADFSQSVTLTISIAPPTVPDVTQQTFGTAEQTLTKLGFTVKENPLFDDKRADGLVIEQNPAAGATNASEVTLSVVRRPVVVYLSDMTPVSSEDLNGLGTGIQKANGKSYSHGVAPVPTRTSVGTVEYDFSRQYRRLVGEIALDDKSPTGAVGKVEIYGDGRLLTDPSIAFGTTTPVDVDVTDVLRLRIAISETGGDGYAQVILGDFKAQGLQSEVESTVTTSTTTSR